MLTQLLDIWDRPPNFILVDYYNVGNVDGSVFHVAAELNNVTYKGECCGIKISSGAPRSLPSRLPKSLRATYLLLFVTTIVMTTL